MAANGEKNFRWMELAITIAVSSAASAIAVTWTLSATLSEFRTKIMAIENHQSSVDANVANLQSTNNLQATQIAVTDANYQNILRELSEIKSRLKK